MREIIGGIIFAILFGYLIFGSMIKEDKLVNEYCSGLSGYEYGQCQAIIY